MKLSPRISWMKAYIELGMNFLPEGTVITRVGTWGEKSTRGSKIHACIYQDKLDGPYRIWLHTHFEGGKFSKIDLLATLAHELAHIIEWKHTPTHKQIESKILSAFMTMLKNEGYTSEEDELKK